MTKKIDTLADLTPDGENFNKHTEFGQKLLEDSLRKFGAGRSILVDKDGNIIAGNSTTETAAAIGMEDVIVVPTDGKKLVVVQRTDLSLDSPEGRELALADNMTALKGIDIDLAKVQETLGDDLAKAWGMEIPEVQKQAQEDDFDPDKPVETVCKKGDIWKLGNHRLMCGDSTNEADVALLFNGEQPYAIVTDPPYCSGGFQESGKKSGSIGTRDTTMIANDTLSTRGYMALIKRVVEKAGQCAMAYVFTDWRMFVNLFDVMEASGYGVRNMIVWDKITPGMGVGWRSQHEICLFASRAAQKFNPHLAQGNVIQCQRTGNVNHPTEKPVGLIGKIIRVTDMAETIYDPFSGSGTTLIACEELGRKCYAMELDPHYCDVIIARWEKLTGNKAEKLK